MHLQALFGFWALELLEIIRICMRTIFLSRQRERDRNRERNERVSLVLRVHILTSTARNFNILPISKFMLSMFKSKGPCKNYITHATTTQHILTSNRHVWTLRLFLTLLSPLSRSLLSRALLPSSLLLCSLLPSIVVFAFWIAANSLWKCVVRIFKESSQK